MTGYIYKITNNVNGKIYIGKTEETVERRFYEHKLCAQGRVASKHSRLYSAMKHYGIDMFSVETIDTANSKEELCEKEKYYISYFNATCKDIGYNLSPGGEGGARYTRATHQSVTNGKKIKFILYEDLNDFLSLNQDWYCCKTKSKQSNNKEQKAWWHFIFC